MSDSGFVPFERASMSPTPEVKTTKLDDFTVQKFGYYVTDNDDEVGNRFLPESPTKADAPKKLTKAGKRTLKIKNSANESKPKSAKGKTPVKPSVDLSKSPIRKSDRKRKAPEKFDALNDSPSPLAKKSKTTNAMAEALLTAVGAAPASESKPKAASTSTKAKAKATPGPESKATAATPKATASSSKKRARPSDDDDDEDFDVSDERSSRAKKAKKSKATKDTDALKDFEDATKDGTKDSTPERPENATLDAPWKCGSRNCTTGMTWLKRGNGNEKSGGFGRKAVSHFFGRNKKETANVHEEVWHWMCRKCYQRNTYQSRKPGEEGAHNRLVAEHMVRLRHQIIRLQIWRPQMRFKVQLIKGAQDRLAKYHRALTKTGVSETDAADSVKFVPTQNKHGKDKKPRYEHEFPIQALDHFDETYAGNDKTFADLVTIVDWVDQLNEADSAPCDPPIEFLPNAPVEGEVIVDPLGPPDNFDRWAAYCDAEALREQQAEQNGGAAAVKAEADGDDEKRDDDDDEKTDIDEKPAVAKEADDADSDDGSDDDDQKPAVFDDEEADDDGSDAGSDDEEDDTEDDAPASRPAPAKTGSLLRATALGRKLGFTGKAGIFPGTGIRAERELEEAERLAAQREAERKSTESEASEVDVVKAES